ncbi:hypothetical protein CHLNCDRAFT_55421 [Chlorella variabilis]|uniref:EF-hand domain-containing protein n=1 Tax=Chlorella variabilis TaxID=554065 RepID=E1ZT54_CHLVA|nr:hypothetical protein CHLNCDRAFT_55421 [Chlorella variabilis]EFN51056.1 hypothetical protein CHLNCDRAFT_55421 [Chlorella variabilis]|eukprot:XP_005843158.1 hypothetical protein CHLNCDRAFT_55421 [Chlorella variabilis]
MSRNISEKQLKELRAAFNMFDSDGSGSIDLSELQNVLRAMGQFPTPVELAQLMERMDADGNGTVDFTEFSEALAGQAEDKETERELQDLQDVFSLFDADGSGLLSADELQRALHILGVSMSRVEVELLIKEIDSNGDGEISCNELLQYVLSFDESGEGPHSGDVERGPRR